MCAVFLYGYKIIFKRTVKESLIPAVNGNKITGIIHFFFNIY